MKKNFLILLFIMVLLPFIKLSAKDMDAYIDWNLDRSVFAHQYKNGVDHVTNLAMITSNGITAYCIQPGVTADKASYYYSTTDINDTKLINVDIKKLSLIGYYGYGYKDHNSKEYYMAAQELIWRLMGVENVLWTDAKIGGNIINIDYYKNIIMDLVNRYEISPKFDFKNHYIVGDEIRLDDKNNVLQDYEVVNNKDVSIDNNSIIIKVKNGDNSFTLRRKENGKKTLFYYKDGYQTIGSFEFPYSYEKTYNINHTYGKIIVNKLDKDTKSKELSSKYASLMGAIYALYDSNNNLIEEKETDENGNVIFDMLPKGNYTIKEIKASKGYVVSKMICRTYLSSMQLSVTTTYYEKIIENEINIIKILDDYENNSCFLEEGILFNIYDSFGNLIKEEITNENGNISIKLPYGKYILKQMNTVDKTDKVKDTIIEVKEDGIRQDIVLVNHKIKEEIPNDENIITTNTLPNTGNNSILNIILTFIFSLIGYIYEKENI